MINSVDMLKKNITLTTISQCTYNKKTTYLREAMKNLFCLFLVFFTCFMPVPASACPVAHVVVNINGTITCQNCPICQMGFGLSIDCHSSSVYKGPLKIDCIPCKPTYFSVGKTIDMCKQCRTSCPVHEYASEKCEFYQDITCSCKSGLYRSINGSCTSKCCYCSRNPGAVEKTCKNVPNKKCQTLQEDGGCDEVVTTTKPLLPSLPSSTTAPTTLSKVTFFTTIRTFTVKTSTANTMKTKSSNRPLNSTTEPKHTFLYWGRIIIPLVIVLLVALSIFYIYRCKKRETGMRRGPLTIDSVTPLINNNGENVNISIDSPSHSENLELTERGSSSSQVVDLPEEDTSSSQVDVPSTSNPAMKILERLTPKDLDLRIENLHGHRSNIVTVLDGKMDRTLEKRITKCWHRIFSSENDDFSQNCGSFEDVLCHIQTKLPEYTLRKFVEVMKKIISEEQ